jgi:starvation-inducible DNA-binding protein
MNNLLDAYKVYLASNFSLYLKTHNAHFNVTGMFFPQLHQLFKDQYEDLWDAYDTIGENIRKLDAFTPASLGEYKNLSVIDDQDGVLSAKEYVERLFKDHERIMVLLNMIFKLAEADNRQADMNFFADRLDVHAKHRWMLKTLLHSVG